MRNTQALEVEQSGTVGEIGEGWMDSGYDSSAMKVKLVSQHLEERQDFLYLGHVQF